MKKTIRLTESDFRRVVKESVKRILSEDWESPLQQYKNSPYPPVNLTLKGKIDNFDRTKGYDCQFGKLPDTETNHQEQTAYDKLTKNGSLRGAAMRYRISNGKNTELGNDLIEYGIEQGIEQGNKSDEEYAMFIARLIASRQLPFDAESEY